MKREWTDIIILALLFLISVLIVVPILAAGYHLVVDFWREIVKALPGKLARRE